MYLDMGYDLVDIPGMNPDGQTAYRVKAISKDGLSPAISALAEFARSDREGFRRIMTGLEMAARTARLEFVKIKSRVSPYSKGEGLYELSAKNSRPRLFFFYATLDDDYVILTHGFQKAWGADTKQTREFELAAEIKTQFLRERQHDQRR